MCIGFFVLKNIYNKKKIKKNPKRPTPNGHTRYSPFSRTSKRQKGEAKNFSTNLISPHYHTSLLSAHTNHSAKTHHTPLTPTISPLPTNIQQKKQKPFQLSHSLSVKIFLTITLFKSSHLTLTLHSLSLRKPAHSPNLSLSSSVTKTLRSPSPKSSTHSSPSKTLHPTHLTNPLSSSSFARHLRSFIVSLNRPPPPQPNSSLKITHSAAVSTN